MLVQQQHTKACAEDPNDDMSPCLSAN